MSNTYEQRRHDLEMQGRVEPEPEGLQCAVCLDPIDGEPSATHPDGRVACGDCADRIHDAQKEQDYPPILDRNFNRSTGRSSLYG